MYWDGFISNLLLTNFTILQYFPNLHIKILQEENKSEKKMPKKVKGEKERQDKGNLRT